MKIFRFVPTFLCISLILGIIFGFYFKPQPVIVILSLLVAILILGISYYVSNTSFSKNIHFNFVSFFLFFVIGIGAITFQNLKHKKNHYSNFISSKNNVVFVITKQLKSNIYYDKFEVEINQLNNNKTIGKVLLNLKKDSLNNYLVDDKLYVSTIFKSINEPKNLYQFNYRKYLEKLQIYHQITCEKSNLKQLKNTDYSFNGIAYTFRKNINDKLKKYHFNKDELSIINALLLGQRQNMSKTLIENYQGAGAVHILAVSGLHIGVLLLLFTFLLQPLLYFKNGNTIRLFLIILLLWLFAFIAGLSASVVRAVTMYTAVAIGLLSNRKSSTLNNLFISMFLLLLVNPLYVFSVGFQLSYLAVFSIVYFYPKFINFYNPQSIYIKKPWQLFAISCSAQIGVLPLSLYYFHQFPSLFFVSSMVIIPILGLILGFGILVICLAALNILPQFLATGYAFIISLMNNFIAFIAKQETFLFKKISFSILLLIASYFLIIYLYRWLDKKSIKRFAFVLMTVICIQVLFIIQKHQLQINKEFIIFNKSKHTLLAHRNGKNFNIFHNMDTLENLNSINAYHIKHGNLNITKNNSVKNMYKFKDKEILVIDSLGVYNIKNLQPEIILLRQSPKINLDRLIITLKPKVIIADASNYKSYVRFWEQTCKASNIKFYSTYDKGAFRLIL